MNTEVVQQSDRIPGHQVVAHRRIVPGAAPVPAAVHGDDAVSMRNQNRDQVTEVVGIAESAVEQQHRGPRGYPPPLAVPDPCSLEFDAMADRARRQSRHGGQGFPNLRGETRACRGTAPRRGTSAPIEVGPFGGREIMTEDLPSSPGIAFCYASSMRNDSVAGFWCRCSRASPAALRSRRRGGAGELRGAPFRGPLVDGADRVPSSTKATAARAIRRPGRACRAFIRSLAGSPTVSWRCPGAGALDPSGDNVQDTMALRALLDGHAAIRVAERYGCGRAPDLSAIEFRQPGAARGCGDGGECAEGGLKR